MNSTEHVEWRPGRCPAGHPWNRPDTFLVGWSFDQRHRGHRSWECLTCGAVIHAVADEPLTGWDADQAPETWDQWPDTDGKPGTPADG